jgi:hypothetical protein
MSKEEGQPFFPEGLVGLDWIGLDYQGRKGGKVRFSHVGSGF